jgi:hypothetical protein
MFDVESVQWFILMAVLVYGFFRFVGVPLDVCLVYLYVAIQFAPYPTYYFTLMFLVFILTLMIYYRRFASR